MELIKAKIEEDKRAEEKLEKERLAHIEAKKRDDQGRKRQSEYEAKLKAEREEREKRIAG